jgi:hypothetical protein
MLIVEHRVNTLAALRKVDPARGVEVDIRDYDGDLRLVHDPFLGGESLEDFLAEYHHALLILNVKCDGLEERILELLVRYHVEEFFFLDVANPTLVNMTRRGIHQVAVRFSEYEPLEFALAFAGRADWVWVDCFQDLPLSPEVHVRLAEHFKICLVSPELQKHHQERIKEFRRRLTGLSLDAVCTDLSTAWLEPVDVH